MIFRNYLQLRWKWSNILCLHNNAAVDDAKSWHAQQVVLWVTFVLALHCKKTNIQLSYTLA